VAAQSAKWQERMLLGGFKDELKGAEGNVED